MFRVEGLELWGPEMGTPSEVISILKVFQGPSDINLRWFREEREQETSRRKVQKALISGWLGETCVLCSHLALSTKRDTARFLL